MIDAVKDIGVIASAALGIITLTTTVVKPIRKRILGYVRKVTNVDSINEEILDLKNEFKKIDSSLAETIKLLREDNLKQTEALSRLNEDVKIANLANKAALGNSIKHIYYKYSSEKKLPIHEIEAIYLLHDAYKSEGGNSFVDGIFDEMMNEWEHVNK